MVSRPRKNEWWRWTLLVCLLLLSLLAPLWWKGTFPIPPRPARPIEGFSVQPVPYDSVLPAAAPRHDDSLVEAPALLTVERSEPAPEVGSAVNQHTSVFENLATRLADVQSKPQHVSGGRLVTFGPLVAGEFDEKDEVLPPAVPQVSFNNSQRLARGVHLASQRDELELHNRGQNVATVWPRPHALIEALESITGETRSQRWAETVLHKLESLGDVPSIESDASAALLDELSALTNQVENFDGLVHPARRRESVLATRDALQRRVEIWRQIQTISTRTERAQFITSISDEQLALRMRSAVATIPGRKAPPAWKDYLGITHFQQAMADGPLDVYDRATMASFALDRLHSPRLDKRQQKLLDNAQFQRLDQLLRQAATQPAEPMDVLFAIEQYELSRTPTDGERLALLASKLRWSVDPASAELAVRIDDNYRAANVRLAITDDFFNRSLPKAESRTEAVDEVILDSYVAGQREVETQLSVKFIPDANHWRVKMHADGKMTSNTTGFARNASLFTQGAGEFSANKLIVVNRHRIHVWPAKSEATYHGDLCGTCTSMEGVPLLGRIARNTAIEGYYERQWAANQEVAARLKNRAAKRLDQQAREQLQEGDAQLTKRILQPLERTSVEAIPQRLSTTEKRVTAEYRLAGLRQLGGHTPRPWAPDNALLSMQIHETAINNVVAGLQLDGRQAHIRDLFPEIYGVFGRDDYEIPDSMPDDVTILFAEENAVRISLQDGRMEVILQLAELRADGRVWRDLTVRNFYAPDPTSLDAKLVRDSTVRLKGKRLGTRDQFALRAIFTKIFGDNNEFTVIPAQLVDAPGLDGLEITQFLIRDGWLGVAIAPPHAGRRTDNQPVEREARRSSVIFE